MLGGGREMSEKKEKVIRVNKLILHAKSVEIVDAEKIEIKNAKNIETNDRQNEGHFPMRDPWGFTDNRNIPMRDPWGFFWGRQTEEEVNQQEAQNENLETDNQ
jgi:hypothetical protein